MINFRSLSSCYTLTWTKWDITSRLFRPVTTFISLAEIRFVSSEEYKLHWSVHLDFNYDKDFIHSRGIFKKIYQRMKYWNRKFERRFLYFNLMKPKSPRERNIFFLSVFRFLFYLFVLSVSFSTFFLSTPFWFIL